MNKIIFILTLSAFLFSQQAEVTNIQAAQRTDGSQIVDITYDLAEDAVFEVFSVTIEVSLNGEDTYTVIENATGDIGNGCLPGMNYVVWNFGSQFNNIYSDEVVYRVSATSTAIIPGDQEVPFEMVEIISGGYVAGLNPTILDTIEYNYEIMKYPVTNAEYAAFLIDAFEQDFVSIDSEGPFGFVTGPYIGNDLPQTEYKYLSLFYTKIRWDGNTFSVLEGFGNHPVTGIHWVGAVGFAVFYGIELPSEAEWEKAARGLNEWNFPWGNNSDDYHQYGHFANNYQNGNYEWRGVTAPVGSYNGETIITPEFSEIAPGQSCITDNGYIRLLDCNMACNYSFDGFFWDGLAMFGETWCNESIDCEQFAFGMGACEESDATCNDLGQISDCSGVCISSDMLSQCLYNDGICADGSGFVDMPDCWGLNFNCEEYGYDLGDCDRDNQRDFSTYDSASPFGIYDLIGNGTEWVRYLDFYEWGGVFAKSKGYEYYFESNWSNIDYLNHYMSPISLTDHNFNENPNIPYEGSWDLLNMGFRCVKR